MLAPQNFEGTAMIRFLTALCASLVGLATLGSAAAQSLEVSHFARLPAFSSPRLSPDGTEVAFLRAEEDLIVVGIASLTDGETRWISVGQQKARSVRWVADNVLLINVTQTNDFGSRRSNAYEFGAAFLVRTDEPNAPVSQLLVGESRVGVNTSLSSVLAVDWEAGEIYTAAYGVLGRNMRFSDIPLYLFAVDTLTGETRMVERGSGETRGWLFDEGGEPVVRVSVNRLGRNQWIELRQDDRWNEVWRSSRRTEMITPIGMAPEGNRAAVLVPGDTRELAWMDLETGEFSDPVLSDPQAEVGGALVDPYTNRIVSAYFTRDENSAHWFDEELEQYENMIAEALPDDEVGIFNWSRDRSVMLVATNDGAAAPDYYLFYPETMSLNFLATGYPALRGVELPDRQRYTYTARDGTDIPAFLTRPAGDGPMPLVILPHGGPASHEVSGFDWLAHGISSQGYLVLQPDFRGSTGYGRAWERAGDGEWGNGIMQHDLTDGVRALIEEGLADPDRVCIVGASYGGYATLAGVTFTPDLYQCGVAIAPVSDLSEMYTFAGGRRDPNNPVARYWMQAMANDEGRGRMRENSPALFADRVTANLLLIHGRDDTVVPLRQSEIMERAMRQAGKPVELIVVDGEDHWLSTFGGRMSTLVETVRFLDTHIGNGAQP
ncbi:S9 family peptidase, partial [Synechococcus moorigangaii CMS01]|nr:S9 family peptidase [Synechococcus moorigangaii CMS01]